MSIWEVGRNTIRTLDQRGAGVSPLWLAIATMAIGIVGYIIGLYFYWIKL